MSIFRNKTVRGSHKVRGNRRIQSAETKSEKNGRATNTAGRQRNRSARNVRKGESNRPNLRRRMPTAKTKPLEDIYDEFEPSDEPDSGGAPPIQGETRWRRMVPFLFSALRFVAVLVSIALVTWGGKLAYDYATTSVYFSIQHVEINGNERLSNGEVLNASGFEMQQNIFSVNLLDVENRLKEQPWIVDASARQKLPKTIQIDVVERKPKMMVLFDVPYLVDETGEIFKRWSHGDPTPPCVITGISKRELIEDAEGAQKVILDAISLFERYNTVGNRRYAKLYEIHREIDGGFSLTVGDEPFYIKLGKAPYREKLNRLAKLFRKMGKDGTHPLIVYFDNEKRPDRVTVKLKPQEE